MDVHMWVGGWVGGLVYLDAAFFSHFSRIHQELGLLVVRLFCHVTGSKFRSVVGRWVGGWVGG